MEITKKGPGRPVGSRDRKNIFLDADDLKIILSALFASGENETEEFHKTLTKLSSLAINILGSSEYLRIIGK